MGGGRGEKGGGTDGGHQVPVHHGAGATRFARRGASGFPPPPPPRAAEAALQPGARPWTDTGQRGGGGGGLGPQHRPQGIGTSGRVWDRAVRGVTRSDEYSVGAGDKERSAAVRPLGSRGRTPPSPQWWWSALPLVCICLFFN